MNVKFIPNIMIGNQVSQGEECHIGAIGTLTIGKGAVYGINAVVTKDVQVFSVAGRVSAKVIKMLE